MKKTNSHVKLIKSKDVIPNTHYFVHNKKKYPIKIDFFKYASKYFSNNEIELEHSKNINLINDDAENHYSISDDTIYNFIKFVQCEEIPLSTENVLHLNFLSKKYEVSTLQELTEEFIIENQQELVIDLLIEAQKNNDDDYSKYEEIISSNIKDYINDDRLLLLNIPTLYRIINKNQNQSNDQVIEFLFKCLSKYGRTASVLFENINFGNKKNEYVNRLQNEYSNIFEFKYISSIIVDLLTSTRKELHLLEEEKNETFKKYQESNLQIKKVIEEQKRTNKKYKELDCKNRKLEEEIEQMRKQHSIEIDTQKQTFKEQIEKMQKEIAILKQKIESDKSKPIISLPYNANDEFNGIIKYLTNMTGGNIHDNGTIEVTSSTHCSGSYPKNVLDFNYDTFFCAKEFNHSWICFNFKSKKIKITNYSIKSHSSKKGCYHPKRLENLYVHGKKKDDKTWKKIDERINSQALNGNCLTGTFYVLPNDFSQFVRFRQTDETWGNGQLWFHYIEFYGYLEQ